MLSDFDLSFLNILWRSLLAALIGFAVGWERWASGSPVRARVISLVAMTAAALTGLSIKMAVPDLSRILAGLLTGIGFIGAGIVIHNDTGEVHGLMTAAALWAMTVVAIAIGAGFILFGALLALSVYVILAWDDWPFATRFRQRRSTQKVKPAGSQEQVEEQGMHQTDRQEE